MQGDNLIAETDGEFTVKRLQLKPLIAQLPMNPAYPTLYPDQLQIFGVVMAFIHKTRGYEHMFVLADVNSFYASCEKVFRPDLRNRPVVVLSNNDGCVIARSAKAKRLGIKMGIP